MIRRPTQATRTDTTFPSALLLRSHRDDEEFGKADVEHGRSPRIAASALDVVVVALLFGRAVVGLARLVAELPGGLVVVAHALLEFLDRAAQVLGAAGQEIGRASGEGKGVSVRVEIRGRRFFNKKNKTNSE